MSKLRVLLVDDEQEFIVTLVERLALREIEAEAALDGAAALRCLAAGRFDVAVIDVKMPGMGGLVLMKEIKKARPELPVILLTGHASTQNGIEGMSCGAFDYLMKPVNIEDLVKIMREAAACAREKG